MKFLSDILAKAGLTVDGVVTLNNTATGQTPAANDNSTKLATTAWVRTFVQPYSLPIASSSILGGIKVGSGLSIDSGTGVLSVTGGGSASIKSTQTFIATAGQTVFTITGGYTPSLIDVFLNGVYLSPNQITATNGTTVTLGEAALAGDIIDVIVASPIYQGATTTTDQLPEGTTNLYYTDARSRAAISLTVTGTSGASTYNSTTGVLNIPTYTLAGLNGVSIDRTITINGVTYDLSANRTWSVLPTGGSTGDILAKASGSNYDVTWIPNYTSEVQHQVKLGATMTIGTPVYVSGSTGNSGTNMIVSKASNASEGTSSKTLGLIASGGNTNDTVFVVTEGLLAGLDTSTATAGDPVWLGVNGTLIFGLLNKPTAPAHLVFIGIVTRAQQNNGEIFVKVQNGFELDELHNLSVASPSDGDMIKYVASTGLWTKIAATTTNITEGTNLYYTQTRFDSAFSAKSTTNLSEGTNLYYTQARFDTAFAAKSTTNLTEGTNLYYTTARVNSDFDTRLATKSTTNLAEGTNLYYTDARVGSYLTTNSYATQSYVATQIANLVASAPAALDTLNELAAALGNDASFSTTVSTALGNRLRIDIGTQGLTSTQQGYGRTNLGLGSLATLSSIGNAYITDLAWSKLSGTPTTIAGYGITDSLVYTTSTYSNPAWITALAWSKITGAPSFLTSYTETDTLSTVTARGASTSTAITLYGLSAGGSVIPLYVRNTATPTTNSAAIIEINARDASGTASNATQLINIRDDASGNHRFVIRHDQVSGDAFAIKAVSGAANFVNTVTSTGFIKSGGTSSQFLKADGSVDSNSYLTSYTETSTLANVTSRGATTSTAVTFSGGASISNLLINSAPSIAEASLAIGAMGVDEGGQLVLNKATSWTYAGHIDIWHDNLRFLYGTNTTTSGVAMAVNLSTKQFILPGYTATSSFTGTAAGVLAFDSSGNILTIAVPGGSVSSVNAGTGVSVNQNTGAVTVSIGQSVATSATPSFDQVFATNNGNGTNFKVGDDAWLGDINASNTIRLMGQQDATKGYIVFGNSDTTALGRSGTGALTYGGNTVYHAGNLTNLNQLTNGPGYITSYTETSTLAQVTARGASTSTRTSFVEVGVTKAGSDTVAAGPWFRWTNVAEDRQMLAQLNASNGLTYWSYNGTAWASAFTLSQAGAGTFTSSVTASSIIKSGGTSSQFLKADGSVDSNSYLTSITSSQVTTALGYTPYNSTNPSGYISSYTETDTLASVTGRGASTSSTITITAGSLYYGLIMDVGSGITTPKGAVFVNGYPTDSTKYYAQFIGNWASAGTWGIGVRGANDNTIYIGQSSSGVISTSVTIDLQVGPNKVLHAGNYTSYAMTGAGYSANQNLNTSSAPTFSSVYTGTAGFGASNNQWTWTDGAHAYQSNSIRLWDQYSSLGGSGNPTTYGTILHITGRSGHLDSQWYMGDSGQLLYRYCFYGTNTWNGWQTLLTSSNYNSYSPTFTGSGASGTWGIRITGFANAGSQRLYSTDSAYNYDAANPYYGYLTYDGTYWLFKVSPASPDRVRVYRSDTSGSADSVSWSNVSSKPTTLAGYGITNAMTNNFLDSAYVDITVNGDANTYYPVNIGSSGVYGMQKVSISRGYSWTAPWDPIGTGVHHGGLTFTLEWAQDIAWGGNDKSIRVIEFNENYTSMVAGLQLAHCEGMIVWLRGGGAQYRIHGPGGSNQYVNVSLSAWTSCAGVTYSPRSYSGSTVDSEINARYPVRGSGNSHLYVNNYRVLNSGDDAYAYNMNQHVRSTDSPTFRNIFSSEGYSLYAYGYNNNGGFAMNNSGTYWGMMWNYATNDWRLGWGSGVTQTGWNLRWDNGSNVWVNNNFNAGGYIQAYGDLYLGAGSSGQVRLSTYNNRNFQVIGGSGGDIGILGTIAGASTFGFQLYADGTNYGFLNYAWGAWDFRKNNGGNLYMNNQSTYYVNPSSWSLYKFLSISEGQSTGGSGRLKITSFTNGASEINDSCYNIMLGPASTRTGAGYYYAGIAINGLMNYAGGVGYDTAAHIWIGAYYRDTPGSERSDFIIAVKSGTGNNNTGSNIPETRVRVDYNGNLTATGDITAYSDIRVKENIITINNPLSFVQSLRGVFYNRTDIENKKRRVGVIAQETEQVLPEVVDKDATGMYNVAYGNMAGLFIEAIKEQQSQIESQKTEIEELKDLVKQLINR